MEKYSEQWKPIKFLAPRKLRTKIRRKARQLGLTISDYLRELTEEDK